MKRSKTIFNYLALGSLILIYSTLAYAQKDLSGGVKKVTHTALYNDAYETFQKGDLEEARRKFEAFLKQYPNTELSDNAQFWIGETYYLKRDFEMAILEYEKAIAKYPEGDKIPAALFKQALAFLELGNKTNAKNLLNRVIERYPNSDQAEMAKKFVLTKLKEEEERSTLKQVEEPIEETRKKVTPRALYNDAYETFQKGDLEEARRKFEAFLKQYPNTELSDNAQFWIGETYYFKKDFDKAILEYEKAIAKYPEGDKIPAALFKQALAFLELGNKTNAKNLLNRVIERYPNSDQAEMAKKLVLTKLKEEEERSTLKQVEEPIEETRKKAAIEEIRKKVASRERREEKPIPPPRTSTTTSPVVTSPSSSQEKITTPQIVKKYSPLVVTIVALDENDQPLSLGSGFFINTDGDIATNHHLLEGSVKAIIKTVDGKKGEVLEIINDDPELDLLIAKTSLKNTNPLPLGDSDTITVGEEIIAIGNPVGLKSTFSAGIISGIRKAKGFQFIQITAPISPGSSGGPVFNKTGRVIGIATSYLDIGQNLNFAMPINYLKTIKPTKTKISSLPKMTPRAGGLEKDGSLVKIFDIHYVRSYVNLELVEFGIRNLSNYPIKNIKLLLVYKIFTGEVISYSTKEIKDTILPKLALQFSHRHWVRHFDRLDGENKLKGTGEVEIRILDYEIVRASL